MVILRCNAQGCHGQLSVRHGRETIMKQYAIMGAANPHAGPDDWTVYAVLPDMEQFQSDKWTGYVAAYSARKDEHVTWALSIPANANPSDPAGWEFNWG